MGKRTNIKKLQVYEDYYTRLKNIALAVFKWDGLPDTCNERFLEETLFHYGQAIFVKDETMSYLNLKCSPASTLNVYNESTMYTAYSNGYSEVYDTDNCVYIRNNYSIKSTDFYISQFAERLARIQLAIDVNINAQKTPILIKCDEKAKMSLERLYNQYDGDKPVIFANKSLEDTLETLKTDAPFVADRLREEKRAVWNEALEFLGINTNPSDKKKERLITDEVSANNEQIEMQCDVMLLCRQEACEQINKLYHLNVTVSRRLDEEHEDDYMEEGVEAWQNTQLN